MTLGKRIKTIREELGFTQEDVAKYVGCAIQTIFKYESEIVTNIPLAKIEKIASALRVNPAYLVGWIKNNNPSNCMEITDTEEHILSSFRKLNADDQKYVVKTIDMVAGRYKDTDYDVAAFPKHKHINIEDNE